MLLSPVVPCGKPKPYQVRNPKLSSFYCNVVISMTLAEDHTSNRPGQVQASKSMNIQIKRISYLGSECFKLVRLSNILSDLAQLSFSQSCTFSICNVL